MKLAGSTCRCLSALLLSQQVGRSPRCWIGGACRGRSCASSRPCPHPTRGGGPARWCVMHRGVTNKQGGLAPAQGEWCAGAWGQLRPALQSFGGVGLKPPSLGAQGGERGPGEGVSCTRCHDLLHAEGGLNIWEQASTHPQPQGAAHLAQLVQDLVPPPSLNVGHGTLVTPLQDS